MQVLQFLPSLKKKKRQTNVAQKPGPNTLVSIPHSSVLCFHCPEEGQEEGERLEIEEGAAIFVPPIINYTSGSVPTNATAPKLRLVSLLSSEGTSHTNKEDNKKQRRAASDFFFPFFFTKSSHRMYTIYTHAHAHSTGRQHGGQMHQREFPSETSRPHPSPASSQPRGPPLFRQVLSDTPNRDRNERRFHGQTFSKRAAERGSQHTRVSLGAPLAEGQTARGNVLNAGD